MDYEKTGSSFTHKFNEIKNDAKRMWDENPIGCIVAVSAMVSAISVTVGKISDSRAKSINAKAWRTEVQRRVRNSKF
jgi:hypothetical protein